MTFELAYMMLYLRKNSQRNRYAPTDWGSMCSYVEIGDDFFVTRRVDVYENGCRLKYDRDKPSDDFGCLGLMQYDQEKWNAWWGPAESIPEEDFEIVWMSCS